MRMIVFLVFYSLLCYSAMAQRLEDIIEPAADKQDVTSTKREINEYSYPINFRESDFENLNTFNQQILSFDVEILRIENSPKNTPYYQGKIGNQTIWIFSMLQSKSLKVRNKVRVVGYLVSTEELKSDINYDKFQILSFGLLDLKSKKLDYFPGSEMQMKQWKHGRIPSSGEE